MFSNLIIFLVFTLATITFLSSKINATQIKGRILCNSSPLVYAKITLYDDDINGPDDEIKNFHTDTDGSFDIITTIPIDDEPNGSSNVYIKIEYKYWLYGSGWDVLSITDNVMNVFFDTSAMKPLASIIDFGNYNFNNDACRSYVSMVSAIHDVSFNLDTVVPVTPVRVTINSGISTTTPQTSINNILLPNGYALTTDKAKYEYAKIMLHNKDGDLTQYNIMSNDYNYRQTHSCTTITNYGMAFDEGFAAWWSGMCTTNSGIDYRIEGNVAYGIRRLQTVCGTNNDQIWNVTASSCPGSLHSFNSFNNKHYELYHCKL